MIDTSYIPSVWIDHIENRKRLLVELGAILTMPPNLASLRLNALNFDDIIDHQDQADLPATSSGPKGKSDFSNGEEIGDEEKGVSVNSVKSQPHGLAFSRTLLVLKVSLLVLLFVGTTSAIDGFSDAEYAIFCDIMVMLLLGFGFLMTFLRKYGLGAVGLTMLLTAMALQLNIFAELLMRYIYSPSDVVFPSPISVATLIYGEFAAATLLISYGAVIGRASPFQLTIMAVFQSAFYALNKVLVVGGWWAAEDVGGTMTIHMFGAYFGMAVSRVMGPPLDTSNASTNAISDVLSLLGTALLWVYWPSFVGATETANADSESRCVIHTVLALLGSTVATFFMSQRLCNKLDPLHIANSTLAGGVAVGASARLNISPGAALLVGILAGLTSVLGFVYVTPILERKALSMYDTCGVHNLHGLPSVMGGFASIVFVALEPDAPFLAKQKSVFQLCLSQFMAMIFTILIAGVSGFVTGHAMVFPARMRRKQSTNASGARSFGAEGLPVTPTDYDDSVYWKSDYYLTREGGQTEAN